MFLNITSFDNKGIMPQEKMKLIFLNITTFDNNGIMPPRENEINIFKYH